MTPLFLLALRVSALMLDTSHVEIEFSSALTLPQVAEYTTRIRQFGDIASAAEGIQIAVDHDDIFRLIEALRELSFAYADLATGPTTEVLGVSGPEAGFPGQSEIFAPPVITTFGTLGEQAQLIMADTALFDILKFHAGGRPEKLYKAILPDITQHGSMGFLQASLEYTQVNIDPTVDMSTSGANVFRLLLQLNQRLSIAYLKFIFGVQDIEGEGGLMIAEFGNIVINAFTAMRMAFEEILEKNHQEFGGPLRIDDDNPVPEPEPVAAEAPSGTDDQTISHQEFYDKLLALQRS